MSLSFSVTATMRQGVWKLFPVVRAMKSSVEVTYCCCRHDDSRLKALPKEGMARRKEISTIVVFSYRYMFQGVFKFSAEKLPLFP